MTVRKRPRPLGLSASIIAALLAVSTLSGCSSINSWLASHVADAMPTWMGGLPADTPPRPSDPRYPEYERVQRAQAEAAKADAANPEAVK